MKSIRRGGGESEQTTTEPSENQASVTATDGTYSESPAQNLSFDIHFIQ